MPLLSPGNFCLKRKIAICGNMSERNGPSLSQCLKYEKKYLNSVLLHFLNSAGQPIHCKLDTVNLKNPQRENPAPNGVFCMKER
jgi:hypothetical protein